jgi:hypothetical protein
MGFFFDTQPRGAEVVTRTGVLACSQFTLFWTPIQRGRATAQAVISRPVPQRPGFVPQDGPCGIFIGKIGIYAGTSDMPCQYYFTNAPYSSILLLPTLYNLNNWQRH